MIFTVHGITKTFSDLKPDRGCCDPEGALAALAGYSSESEHSDAEMLPKLEPDLVPITVEVINTSSCFPTEDQGKADAHGTPQGILPLANVSSLAELNVHSNNAIMFTTEHEV